MADTAQRTTTGLGGSFMKLKRAASRIYEVLSQEKHAIMEDDEEKENLRLALEMSIAQQLRDGYVLDFGEGDHRGGPCYGTNINPAIDNNAEAVAEAMREEARLLREAQDSDFAKALAQDQTRERSRQQREAWRKLHRRMRKKRLQNLRARIVPEPAINITAAEGEGEKEATTSLVLRFPDGSRAERRFRAVDRLADVRSYVEALALEEELKRAKLQPNNGDGPEAQQRELSADEDVAAIMEEDRNDGDSDEEVAKSRFHFVSSYPRRRLVDFGLTLREAGLCPTGVLFLQSAADGNGAVNGHHHVRPSPSREDDRLGDQ